MVLIQFNELLERLSDILKDDDTFSKKIDEFFIGEYPKPENRNQPSACFISTIPRSWQNADRQGRSIPNSDFQGIVQLSIQINGFYGEPMGAKKDLLGKIDDVLRILQANPTLLHPDDNNDAKCVRSTILSTEELPKFKGTVTPIGIITIQCQIGSQFSITFPSIGIVQLLSKPNNPDGIVFSEDKQGASRVLTKNGEFGALFVEYESTKSLDDQFRAKYGDEEDIVLHTSTGDRTIKIQYIEINPTAPFDGLERSILHMEIIPS